MLTHIKSKARSKARQELDKDREFILWLFDSRCIMCGKPTNIIHEVVPISHGKSALHWTNRVTLCNNHHVWAHESTNKSIPVLQAKRLEFVKRLYPLNFGEEKGQEFLENLKILHFDTVSEFVEDVGLVVELPRRMKDEA